MKRLFSKLALVFTITLMASISTSCGNDDEDISEKITKECTFYITTDNLKIDAGASFTKEQLAKEYSDALYNGCEGKSLNDEDLLDVIFATYNKQLSKGWIKYIHGTTLIMCHMKSSNKDFAMYEYNVDTNKMSDFVVAD